MPRLKAARVSDILNSSDKLLHAETARYLKECRPKVVVLTAGTCSFLLPLKPYALRLRSLKSDLIYPGAML